MLKMRNADNFGDDNGAHAGMARIHALDGEGAGATTHASYRCAAVRGMSA